MIVNSLSTRHRETKNYLKPHKAWEPRRYPHRSHRSHLRKDHDIRGRLSSSLRLLSDSTPFPIQHVHPVYYWAFAWSDAYWNQAKALSSGGGQPQFNANALKQVKIPLPSLETQHSIVAEIEAEQVGVEVCRELVERFEGKIRKTIGRVWDENGTS